MDAFFAKLGRTVLDRWKAANFSLEAFPAIAHRAIDERPPAKHVKLDALMRDFLLSEDQPFQTDSPFGEPEIIAYTHPRFYIQLLFWMDGTTAIHQHAFSGAFHVMHGSSIHAHYTFERAKSITPHIRVGQLRMKGIEILDKGRTVPIISGPETIHSLFHLDSPSVTVVVRTQHDAGTGPQFNYLPPHIAIDPTHGDLLTMRRKQLLDVIEQTDEAGFGPTVLQMSADLDFERGFSILQHTMDRLQAAHQWEEALAAFKRKHGTIAAGVGPTLEEEARRDVIKGLRGSITDPEHRFFLALLMNAPSRVDLFKLVAQRFPKTPPAATILRWASELIEVTEDGVVLLDATFPETVAAEADDHPAIFLAAFEYFLSGGKGRPTAPTLKGLKPLDLKDLRDAFGNSALALLA